MNPSPNSLADRLRAAATDLEEPDTDLNPARWAEIIRVVREAAELLTRPADVESYLSDIWHEIPLGVKGGIMAKYPRGLDPIRLAVREAAETLDARPEAPSRTLENVAMFARRGLSFGKQATPMTPERIAAHRALMLEAILDKCEQAGVTSSPLRESPSPPTEAKP